jgi:hypothetical protein
MGFHAPQEAMRILGDAINLCRLGQLSLHGGPTPSHHPPNIAESGGRERFSRVDGPLPSRQRFQQYEDRIAFRKGGE